jgi:hypothetical protein
MHPHTKKKHKGFTPKHSSLVNKKTTFLLPQPLLLQGWNKT